MRVDYWGAKGYVGPSSKIIGGPGPPLAPPLPTPTETDDRFYLCHRGKPNLWSHGTLGTKSYNYKAKQKNLVIQSNFNGSNMSGSMKICSRQEQSVLMSVNHCSRSGGITGIFFDSINIKKEIFLKYFKYNNFCSYESFS